MRTRQCRSTVRRWSSCSLNSEEVADVRRNRHRRCRHAGRGCRAAGRSGGARKSKRQSPATAASAQLLASENDRVRVWTISLKPGERLPFHKHVLDYFWTATAAGTTRSHYSDGRIGGIVGEARRHPALFVRQWRIHGSRPREHRLDGGRLRHRRAEAIGQPATATRLRPKWRSLRESNPSFKIENLAS